MPNYLKHLIRIGLFPYIIFLINYSTSNLFPAQYLDYKLDIPMHILGGIVAALSIDYTIQLLEKNKKMMISNLLLKWALIITTVIAIAVLWEFYEFISDYFYGTIHQPTIFDTIKDLFNGMLGAIIACLLFIRNKR